MASEPELDFRALPAVPSGSTLAAEWWIAWGHLRSKKSEAFLSLVTVFSIVGVTAGVAMLNIVIAVMTGFEIDLRDKILGANAHIVVFRATGPMPDYDAVVTTIDQVPGVIAAAPFVYTEMMIRSPFGATGVVLKGVDLERTGKVTQVVTDLQEGLSGPLETVELKEQTFKGLASLIPSRHDLGADRANPTDPPLPGILIGKELRDTLQVRPGDVVQLVNPMGGPPGPMGMPTPSVKNLRIAAIFNSGMYEYDTKWTYVTNETAQSLLDQGKTANGIEIKVDDIDAVERIAANIQTQLGPMYYTRHWKQLNEKLFHALEVEKWVMGLLLNLVTVNAGLLIITTLFMLVITKGREIAILKAMGASQRTILRIFIMEGSTIGLAGMVFGTALGLAGCAFLKRYEYPLETDVYYLATLPVVVDPTTVVVIAVSAFVICFLCTIYPAWRAAALDPVEAMRYE